MENDIPLKRKFITKIIKNNCYIQNSIDFTKFYSNDEVGSVKASEIEKIFITNADPLKMTS